MPAPRETAAHDPATAPLDEQESACRAALARDPADADTHLALARLALLRGDYATGWREYESRLRLAGTAAPRRMADIPRWDGSNPAGRSILVHCESDLGACVQFARYLPLLVGRGAEVVLTCPPPLLRLLSGMPHVCPVTDGDPPPRTDFYVELGSLPLIFETTPATIPTFAAYLRPAPSLVAAWRHRLAPLRSGGQRLVGVAGTELLESLRPLASALRSRFVLLDSTDPAETAAKMSLVDLVITGDDLAAHLAGALGRSVWTLIGAPEEWPWSAAGDDAAWYPTMRLFRSDPAGDRSTATADVIASLKALPPVVSAAA
jgi:hypothetical protein